VNASSNRPEPGVTAETAHYWEAARQGRLEIQYCRACARHQFYPRHFCTQCLSDRIEWVQASGKGHIYTYTVCRIAGHPAFADRLPYAIAMVQLAEGVRMVAGIADEDLSSLAVGAAVEVCFERISDQTTLPMFRLARIPSSSSENI
jgi:uncharacterized OB-fold protein